MFKIYLKYVLWPQYWHYWRLGVIFNNTWVKKVLFILWPTKIFFFWFGFRAEKFGHPWCRIKFVFIIQFRLHSCDTACRSESRISNLLWRKNSCSLFYVCVYRVLHWSLKHSVFSNRNTVPSDFWAKLCFEISLLDYLCGRQGVKRHLFVNKGQWKKKSGMSF